MSLASWEAKYEDDYLDEMDCRGVCPACERGDCCGDDCNDEDERDYETEAEDYAERRAERWAS